VPRLIASLSAVAVNVLAKVLLTDTYGVVGLALGTAIGIWVNLGLLVFLATRRDWMAPSGVLGRTFAAVVLASLLLAAFAWFAPVPVSAWTDALPAWRSEILLGLLGTGGALIYGAALLVGLKLLGVRLSRR
jgi:putative peptidoglycan lipid II flippase